MQASGLTAERLPESCLKWIHAREGVIHAQVEVYELEALAEARRCDRECSHFSYGSTGKKIFLT